VFLVTRWSLCIDRFAQGTGSTRLYLNSWYMCSYALMGFGVHGNLGINVSVIHKMDLLYVIPNFTYNLESWPSESTNAHLDSVSHSQRVLSRNSSSHLTIASVQAKVLGLLGIITQFKALSLHPSLATCSRSHSFMVCHLPMTSLCRSSSIIRL
jgi:hypothetical protein